ncbi:hypothetical protein ElyMa_002525000 [Elysia marginata]|uniref:Uncharacterized protein n=1 Tax=Elysia marginata TaxID=1093978 RepID=A0AAV4GSF1_9GAST|nr:hypothetical protein ElyMa_002525000 [Elysia marginata]
MPLQATSNTLYRVLQAHIANSSIACSWVPILQVGGLGKVRVNCFPKAIATWHGRESKPRPPDHGSDALTTLICPVNPVINYEKDIKREMSLI